MGDGRRMAKPAKWGINDDVTKQGRRVAQDKRISEPQLDHTRVTGWPASSQLAGGRSCRMYEALVGLLDPWSPVAQRSTHGSFYLLHTWTRR